MNREEMPQLDAIAAAMGDGWRHNKIMQTGYSHYLTNGKQKIAFRYQYGANSHKVTVSVCFPNNRPANHSHHNSIGVSINRPPKTLAADIKRRLLVDYAKNLQAAIDKQKEYDDKKTMDEMIINSFRKLVPLSYHSHCNGHHFGDSHSDYPQGWIKQNYSKGDQISLELHNLNPEQVCKILALLQPDLDAGRAAAEERAKNTESLRERIQKRNRQRKAEREAKQATIG